jgi:hypothetical protein
MKSESIVSPDPKSANLTVSDMGDEFTLISDSQEIEHILNNLGWTGDEHEQSDGTCEWGCLFVEILDGDYGRIYGCHYSVPYNHLTVYPVTANLSTPPDGRAWTAQEIEDGEAF